MSGSHMMLPSRYADCGFSFSKSQRRLPSFSPRWRFRSTLCPSLHVTDHVLHHSSKIPLIVKVRHHCIQSRSRKRFRFHGDPYQFRNSPDYVVDNSNSSGPRCPRHRIEVYRYHHLAGFSKRFRSVTILQWDQYDVSVSNSLGIDNTSWACYPEYPGSEACIHSEHTTRAVPLEQRRDSSLSCHTFMKQVYLEPSWDQMRAPDDISSN